MFRTLALSLATVFALGAPAMAGGITMSLPHLTYPDTGPADATRACTPMTTTCAPGTQRN